MCDACGDNRSELIEKYKQKLIESTNISDSPEEMAVIDNILFRFWQMGWLNLATDTISRATAIETVRKAKSIGQAHRMLVQLPPIDAVPVVRCKDCKHYQFADDRAFGFPVKRCEVTGFEDVDDKDFCSRGERKDGYQNG